MLTGKQVLIISPDQLMCLGLKTILTDYFSAETVITSASRTAKELDHSTEYIFMRPDTFALDQEWSQLFRNKIILLVGHESPANPAGPAALNLTSSISEIIDQLRRIFSARESHRASNKLGSLTEREIEVLKLVARGEPNKLIADRLSISMHTVISHRKNITRKLGIKTVSGLTMYAVLNGLVSSKDIS